MNGIQHYIKNYICMFFEINVNFRVQRSTLTVEILRQELLQDRKKADGQRWSTGDPWAEAVSPVKIQSE